MKLYLILLITFTLFSGLLFLTVPQTSTAAPIPALERAQSKLDKVGTGTGLGARQSDSQIYARVAQIINIVLGLTGIIATIYLIYGGIKWLRSGGNEQTVTEAKAVIRSAIVGVIVVLSSYVIVNFLVVRIIEAVA